MKHQHISSQRHPLLMIKAGNKVNILSDGEMPEDIEYLTFDTIKDNNTPKVFRIDNVITSRKLEDKYPNNSNPVITEYNVTLTDISYNDILNK